MKKIIVCTDLSANSKAGIRFAIQLQKQSGCHLVFYHAIELMKPTSWSDARYKAFARGKNAEFTEKLIAFVHQVYDAMGEEHGNNSYKTEIGTRVAAMSLDMARKAGAGAICMATRGAGKLGKLLGSVATSLLISSPVPVMIVPPKYRAAELIEIQYATDLESFTAEFNKVRPFANALGAKLAVVHYDHLLTDSAAIGKLEAKYKKHVTPDVRLLFRKKALGENFAECIRRDLKKDRPSMLVLFTKLSKGWFRRLFTVSRTQEIALHPTLPLLVFRKKE